MTNSGDYYISGPLESNKNDDNAHNLSVSPRSISERDRKLRDSPLASAPLKEPFGPDVYISRSCDDILQKNSKETPSLSRSQSCVSLNSNHLPGTYDHVQSKIKQYIKKLNEQDASNISKPSPKQCESSKEEYLKEINSRLSRELEEKNAILQQLQENYEHLLLKYAEAQNKIDNLRLKSINDSKEASAYVANGSKPFRKRMAVPSVYPFKSGELHAADVRPTMCKMDDRENRIDRPSSLAVEGGLRIGDRDAVTPTDSEGVSSVITSMSGHSKILTNLDDTPRENGANKMDVLKTEALENVPVNDSFDKVKHWQNSLPPLEMIETPDTSLYDIEPLCPATTLSTRYNDFPPLSDIPETLNVTSNPETKPSQAVMKKYLRTLSLPSNLTRRNMMSHIYKRRNNHTIDVASTSIVEATFPTAQLRPSQQHSSTNATQSSSGRKTGSTNLIRKRRKRPPFLRSASLPIYDIETARSNVKNKVPQLDLENLTLSEVDSSSGNDVSSESFRTSHECSFQTLDSLNSCKATVSDFSHGSYSRQLAKNDHKSTSITPDRSKEMILFDNEDANGEEDCCNVCGESVLSMKAASYQAIHLKSQDSSPYMAALPVQRSFSFSSDFGSTPRGFHGVNSNRFLDDSFSAYTNNLKARSQVIMKALTAHVKNA